MFSDTEIDFTTYMRHIDLYLGGERNYTLFEGPSGPLVSVRLFDKVTSPSDPPVYQGSYPAGHVLVHRLLYPITSAGDDIRAAQLIYSVLYFLAQFLSFAIFDATGKIPTWVLPLLALSKRLHSIYVLRLFNDCWAIPTLFAAILAYCKGYFTTGSVLFRCVQQSFSLHTTAHPPVLSLVAPHCLSK
jgi:alpha-1,3-mannosyltransferase